MNTMFMDAEDVGLYPASCKNAWTAAIKEAMQNLGLRDDPEQEEWEQMGPLANPTPTNAKNKGISVRKKGRVQESRNGNKGRGTATEAANGQTQRNNSGEDASNNSEMQVIGESVSEAIREMETKAAEQQGSEVEMDGVNADGGAKEMIDTEGQQQQQQQ